MAKRNENETNEATGTVDLKKAAKLEKRKAKKAALVSVLAFCTENEALSDEVALLTPGRRFGAMVSTAKSAVLEMIQSAVTVTEDEIWNEHKLGRAEMRKIIVNCIKKAKNPDERVWISFDPEAGVYSLVAEGADTPKGWTGYRPVDVEDIKL